VGVDLNKTGIAYAKNLARRSSVDKTSAWTFDAADTERLLGPDGADVKHFGKYHLGASASKDSKDCFAFPFGKAGKVYRSAVVEAQARATQDGNEELANAAAEILELIDSIKQDHADGATESVTRVDYYDYRDWQTAKMERTPEGYLIGRAVVTNIGVFPYQNEDGTLRYELRHPDDVFDESSLASLNGKPLTNDHPMQGVDPQSVKDLGVGTVHSPGHDAYHVSTGVVIQRQDGVAAVEGGKISLSCGYNCDLVPERGNFHGTQYTHRQKNIRYNHVALVSEGRAGDAAKLRMDGAMPVLKTTTQNPTKGETMAKLKLDSGVEFEVVEAVASHIDSLTADKKTAEAKALEADKATEEALKKVKDAEGALDAKCGELDSLKTQVSTLTEKLTAADSAESVKKMVDARLALIAKGVEVGAKIDSATSDREIQLAIIALETADSMDGKSDEYIAARVDSAYTHLKTHPHTPAPEAGGQSHGDGTAFSGAANELALAYQKRSDTLADAWKGEKGKE
jgi:hypothetical protein